MEGWPILKYLIAVTGILASLAFLIGLVLSFAYASKKQVDRMIVWTGIAMGVLAGFTVFGVRMYDPKGMNLPLTRFNRWVLIALAVISVVVAVWTLISIMLRECKGIWKTFGITLFMVLIVVALMYHVPSIVQFTREFVYFGESGISTKAMLRAIGFSFGLILAFLVALSAFMVQSAVGGRAQVFFLLCSAFLYVGDYGFRAVAAMQRMKLIPLTDLVFQLMIWGDEYGKWFIYGQMLLALVMLAYVIVTHLKPVGEFANRAQLRKEKARLRDCRRWSWSMLTWGIIVVFTLTVLNYYDTKPAAEVVPEPYDMVDGKIRVELAKVSDGHLHKFEYMTPNKYNVRFLVVKKSVGSSYGVGLDACEICGIAGYFERGEDIVCRRCDVVMNKNTIGFKGGCNPLPFPFDVKDGYIYIEPKELELQERRFR